MILNIGKLQFIKKRYYDLFEKNNVTITLYFNSFIFSTVTHLEDMIFIYSFFYLAE